MTLPLTETQFQSKIIDLAHARGWLVHHDRPARDAKGNVRTHIQGDAGFPDLVLVRGQDILIVEVKTDQGALSPAQRKWFTALTGSGKGRNPHRWDLTDDEDHVISVEVWRPTQWHMIEEILA